MTMRWFRVARLRLRTLVNRDAVEEELDEEIRFHLEMQTEAYVRQGLGLAEAQRQAMLNFGGVEGHREAARDARGLRWLEEAIADVRFAARSLRRSPLLTSVVVLTLALGLGANSALFGLIDAAFFRLPAGLTETDRLVWLDTETKIPEVSYPDYQDISASASGLFTGIAAYTSATMTLGTSTEPERVAGQLVSSNYFRVLGAAPATGRGFLEEEGRIGAAAQVVVLGHELWTERFGADPRIVGRSVALNGHPFVVVGVAPPDFVGVDAEERADLWVPAATQSATMPRGKSDVLRNRRLSLFRMVGTLRPNVDPESWAGLLDVVARRASAMYPERHLPLELRVTPLRGWMSRQSLAHMAPMIGFAWLITAVVLAIACANVANLMLVRMVSRRREIGIRLALGAGRARLIRLLLTEALLLAIAGGAAGVFIAYWAATWFRLHIDGPWGPLNVSPGLRALGFTLGLTLLTGIILGLVPAHRASRPAVTSALKGEDATWLRRARLQGGLVVLQLALSMVLLTSAALFLRRLQAQQHFDVGFDTGNVLSLTFDLEALGYSAPARTDFYSTLRSRLQRIPGVEAVAMPTAVPLAGSVLLSSISTPGDDEGSLPRMCGTSAAIVGVAPRFFEVLGIPVLRGRPFKEEDIVSSERTVVISESLARECWPGQDPVGKRVTLDYTPDGASAVILGIAGDIALTRVGGSELPQAFVPESQSVSLFAMSDSHLLVRTAGDPGRLVPMLRAEFRRLDPRLPLTDVKTMARAVDEKVGFQRRLTGLIVGFGAVALLLAALGLYGVVAFTVAGRTREIGVRMALGARSTQVVGGFVRNGLRLALIGATAGVAISLGVARVLRSITAGIDVVDPTLVAEISVLLGAVALLASWFPARRAARVDPLVALRSE